MFYEPYERLSELTIELDIFLWESFYNDSKIGFLWQNKWALPTIKVNIAGIENSTSKDMKELDNVYA